MPATSPSSGLAILVPTMTEILEYLDYRNFLRDRLEQMHARDRKYSQRWVAMRAGFKSPQLLSMIVTGQRNLTKDKAIDLAKALKLEPRESEYFQLIVELASCEGRAAQQALLQKIQTSFHDGLFKAIDDSAVEIFRDWYYPAIREIVTLTACDGSAAWIAGHLGIATADAARAIDTLVAIGYLKRAGDGKLVRSEPSVRTARNKVYPMLLGAWHMKMLEQAFRAIRLGRDKRHLEGLTFAVPLALVPAIKERIQRFFRETDAFVEGETAGRDHIYHLHIAMFPLTGAGLEPNGGAE